MTSVVSRTSTEATTVEQLAFPLKQKVSSLDDHAVASIGIALMDNTTLGDNDTNANVDKIIGGSVNGLPHTAAICVYGKFVAHARKVIDSDPEKYKKLLVATVVNFPHGSHSLEEVVAEATQWVVDGADELDLVINYKSAIANETDWSTNMLAMVKAVKSVCVGATRKVALKVIIESGELKSADLIAKVSECVLAGGCDFVKTSTGKVPVNATTEAARVMLQTIAAHQKHEPAKSLGFKAAGGVKNVKQTREFLQVAEDVMGVGWISPATFRFGASSLLGELRACLKGEDSRCATQSGYDFDDSLMSPDAPMPPVCLEAGLARDLSELRWHLDACAKLSGRLAAQALSAPAEFGTVVWGSLPKMKDLRPTDLWSSVKPYLISITLNSFSLASRAMENLQHNPTTQPLLQKLNEFLDRPAFYAVKQAVMKSVGKLLVSN